MASSIIDILIEELGEGKVLTGDKLKGRYSHIWTMNEPLTTRAVLLPNSTKDVSRILKICNHSGQNVVIHGGLTGLTGATSSAPSEIVISLEKMNQIEEVDTMSRTMTVQAGVILQNVQEAAKEKALLFPLNFGAKGSAQMGGIIATNAGGLRVFRYGMTRSLILGLEAVIADGTIISSMKKIIKDNSAYDIKQLFIGSEGTLGIITKAVIKLVEAPKSRVSAFVGISSYEKVVAFLKFVDSGLAGTLSAYEIIWQNCYRAMTSPPAMMKPPLPQDYNYYILLECLGSKLESDTERIQELLEEALNKQLIEDAVLANNESDLNWFWTIREDVAALAIPYDDIEAFDISLPIPLIGALINDIKLKLNQIPDVLNVFAFGHVADGNIHLVVAKANNEGELSDRINQIIYSPLKEAGGSISAEHGIGILKKQYLHLSRSSDEINLMKTLKKTLDPNFILNKGRVFD